MSAGPRIDHYDWSGGREAMLRLGPDSAPLVVAAMPLFEEANRTRAFLLAILRALAAHGIGSALPDLPGQGDSELPTERMTWHGLRGAFAAAAAQASGGTRRVHSLAIRSGALVDGDASLAGRWRLAPQDGPELSAELQRLQRAGDAALAGRSTGIAGNLVPPAFLEALDSLPGETGAPLRVLRLTTDPRPADRTVDGSPLWRRSEPGTDPGLARLLADDIAGWIARCEG